MFIDTHCHLEKKYYDDIDKIIEDNRKAGIDKIIVSGCEKEEIKEVLEYAEKYEDVYLTLGFHPEYADLVTEEDIIWLKQIIITNKKVIGMGEIGLDYYYSKENREKQITLFRNMLELAKELSLDNIVLETDSPYLSPTPLRGTVNSSKNIPFIVNELTKISGISDEKIGKITSMNVSNIFNI